jgi:hypothetical protein
LALYLRVGGRARIELYDEMLGQDDKAFCGSPEAPLPFSVYSIIHEIGHAIADAAPASAYRNFSRAVSTFEQREDELSEKRPGPREGTYYVSKEEGRELDEKFGHAEFALDQVKRLGKYGPVLRAYRWARGTSRGPTPYGRVSLDESFAEAFAMFHTDPAALRRVDAKAYEWLGRSGHIQALAD